MSSSQDPLNLPYNLLNNSQNLVNDNLNNLTFDDSNDNLNNGNQTVIEINTSNNANNLDTLTTCNKNNEYSEFRNDYNNDCNNNDYNNDNNDNNDNNELSKFNRDMQIDKQASGKKQAHWDKGNTKTALMWIQECNKQQYIYKTILDTIVAKATNIKLFLLIITALQSLLSVSDLGIDKKHETTVLSIKIIMAMLSAIAYGLTQYMALKKYEDTVKEYTVYIEKLTLFLSNIVSTADMKAQLRPDGDKFILDNKEKYAELFRTCPYMAQSSWEYGATKYENYLDNVNDDININNKILNNPTILQLDNDNILNDDTNNNINNNTNNNAYNNINLNRGFRYNGINNTSLHNKLSNDFDINKQNRIEKKIHFKCKNDGLPHDIKNILISCRSNI